MVETVTIGDTEVEVQETEDGFEATEAEDDPEGVYLRAGTHFGFEVPIDADYVIDSESTKPGKYYVAWHTDDDISEMKSKGRSDARRDGYDGYASVRTLEIVEH
mgnify:CR=1 FL=1